MFTIRSQGINKVLGLHMFKADGYITKSFGRKDISERVRKSQKDGRT